MTLRHRAWSRGLLFALLLLHTVALSAGAGEPLQDSKVNPYDTVTRIVPGRPIRLTVPEYGEITGHFLSNSTDSLFMDLHGETRSVPLEHVDRLWVRGNSMGPGLLIGGGVGFLTLAVLYSSQDSESDEGAGVLFSGLMGALLGGFAGSMVGLAVPRWKLKYDAEDRDDSLSMPVEADSTEGSPAVDSHGRREESPKVLVEAFGGHAFSSAPSYFGGRVLIIGNPSFHFGAEVSRFAYEDSVDPFTGFSFLCGPRFKVKGLRPHLLFGAGFLVGGGYEDEYGFEENQTSFGFQVSPGIRIGLGRWGILAEVKYHGMALGWYEDLFAAVGGLSYSF